VHNSAGELKKQNWLFDGQGAGLWVVAVHQEIFIHPYHPTTQLQVLVEEYQVFLYTLLKCHQAGTEQYNLTLFITTGSRVVFFSGTVQTKNPESLIISNIKFCTDWCNTHMNNVHKFWVKMQQNLSTTISNQYHIFYTRFIVSSNYLLSGSLFSEVNPVVWIAHWV